MLKLNKLLLEVPPLVGENCDGSQVACPVDVVRGAEDGNNVRDRLLNPPKIPQTPGPQSLNPTTSKSLR